VQAKGRSVSLPSGAGRRGGHLTKGDPSVRGRSGGSFNVFSGSRNLPDCCPMCQKNAKMNDAAPSIEWCEVGSKKRGGICLVPEAGRGGFNRRVEGNVWPTRGAG